MVSVPAYKPVTKPADTVDKLLDALHIPPVAVSVSMIVDPIHKLESLEIAPATGSGTILTIVVVVVVPQALLTE